MSHDPKPTIQPSPPTDKPSSLLERLIAATPVVLSIIATILAGLSSRELVLAQYYRSFATQSQSKAGDQWGFFQAKRIRETTLRATLDLLEAVTPPEKVTPQRLREESERLVRNLEQAERQLERL